MIVDDNGLKEILNYKVVAVVGCSLNLERPSNRIATYLQSVGYKVIPVNPGHPVILGEKCYPNLLEIPETVEIVNIFRKSEHVFPVVMDAIRIKAKAIWMQDGVEHFLADETATRAGLKVVMDNCILREHVRLQGPYRKNITHC